MEEPSDRAALARDVLEWKALMPGERLATAPVIIERYISVWSTALRQDLAKDQILKAIAAFQRGRIADLQMHLEIADSGLSYKPVGMPWQEIRQRLAMAIASNDDGG